MNNLPNFIDYHLENTPHAIKSILDLLRIRIKKLHNVEEYATRRYIGYKLKGDKTRLFVEMHVQKRNKLIVLHLRPIEYNDPKKRIFSYGYSPPWPLRSGINISTQDELDYALPLVKASYKAVVESL